MSDAPSELKQFAPGERDCYVEVLGDRNLDELLLDLDDIRPSLTRYPRGYEVARDTYNAMPYYGAGTDQVPRPNPQLDALAARQIADIMFSFARRLKQVRFRDEVPGDIDLHSVDLSAANDEPVDGTPARPDDAAIRRSYMDNAPESTQGNADVEDVDVARHGDHADQCAVDSEHAQSRNADAQIREQGVEDVLEIIDELGGAANAEYFADSGGTDIESDGTGSDNIQLGMMYAAHSRLGGETCGVNCAKLFFSAVLNGTPGRLGLAERLKVLTEYGEITDAEIAVLVEKIEEELMDL